MKIATLILAVILVTLNSGFGQTTDSRKSTSTKPTLAATLAWMHNTLDSGLGDTATTDEVRQNRMSSASCDVTFVYQTLKDSKATYRNSNTFNLKSIDPTSIAVTSSGHDILGKKASSRLTLLITQNLSIFRSHPTQTGRQLILYL